MKTTLKNKILMTAVMASSIFAAGCSSKNSFKSQSTSIQLKGNPTTGYTWACTVENENVVSVEEFQQYLGEENQTGAPSRFTYNIRELKSGTSKIHFAYQRPWEDEPIDNKTYFATIDKKGNIEVKEVAE